MTDKEIDDIEARARKRVRPCEWAASRGAPASEFCGAPCVKRCAYADCGIERCGAHAEPFSGACEHEWRGIDNGADDVLALVKALRLARSPEGIRERAIEERDRLIDDDAETSEMWADIERAAERITQRCFVP